MRLKRSVVVAFLVLCGGAFFFGCSGSKGPRVKGKVTLDGKPLSGAQVTFEGAGDFDVVYSDMHGLWGGLTVTVTAGGWERSERRPGDPAAAVTRGPVTRALGPISRGLCSRSGHGSRSSPRFHRLPARVARH